MNVRYPGPSTTGVEVVHPDPQMPDANTVTVCPRGETVDLPDDIAVAQMAAGVLEPADRQAEAALRRHQRAESAAGDDQHEPLADVGPGGEGPSTEENT